jgi:hypothetical protein
MRFGSHLEGRLDDCSLFVAINLRDEPTIGDRTYAKGIRAFVCILVVPAIIAVELLASVDALSNRGRIGQCFTELLKRFLKRNAGTKRLAHRRRHVLVVRPDVRRVVLRGSHCRLIDPSTLVGVWAKGSPQPGTHSAG